MIHIFTILSLFFPLISFYKIQYGIKINYFKKLVLLPLILWLYYFIINLYIDAEFVFFSFDKYFVNSYKLGQVFSQTIISFMLCCLIPFLDFKLKLNFGFKHPFLIFLFLIISIINQFNTEYIHQQSENKITIRKVGLIDDSLRDIELSVEIIKKNLPFENEFGLIAYEILFSKEKRRLFFVYKFDYSKIKNQNEYQLLIDNLKQNWEKSLKQISDNSINKKQFVEAQVTTTHILFDNNEDVILSFDIIPN